ncbi:putative filament-like plant protein [Medicago truncatula]|uniref:Filament-like plant protein n=2 Tax=Medicago truncatula TaxID=3880 RepID=A0A072UQ33_MEDTR|nr:filament-like plant protein 7 [Medicago truncatula]KEH31456.1 filament-like plant protein [Medicago truncatula]RHN62959.1 putative filament-like plant protein [Medicago truncatula]
MDQKSWPWRKKSSEKTILTTENGEVHTLLADKEELEKDFKELENKLASALSECNSKDELAKKQTKIAQEAVAGLEKAKVEVLSVKQGLDEALRDRLVYEERVAHLDGALKECMQQLRFVREEQGQRIHDAVMKASKEFEKECMVWEDQLSVTSKRLAKVETENSHLNTSIFQREKLIEDLKRQLTQAEADHSALMVRLESTEKDNASLTYEVRVLEKELEIRNEEREFGRRTADVSHKHHLENVKKIAKLESECQRLRLLVRKRLPGPGSLAKMKNEAEMLGRDTLEIRRNKLNSTSSMVESSLDSSPGTPRRISTLTEQLYAVEEENKALKDSLSRKMNELQFSRVMLSRTASKLLQLESHNEESSKGQVAVEQLRSNLCEFSLASTSDIGSDDKVSCADSSASALNSESEHFRSGKQKESWSCRSIGASDINLMDDFVEMEKLAVVSVEKDPEISGASLKEVAEISGFSETRKKETTLGHILDFSTSNEKTCALDELKDNIPSWLQDVVKMILEQNHVTQKNPDDVLENIRVALRNLSNPDPRVFGLKEVSGHIEGSDPSNNSLVVVPSSDVNITDFSPIKRTKQQAHEDPSKSIGKIIELIERINLPAEDCDNSDPLCTSDETVPSVSNSGTPTGYMVRVFQWKTSELSNILQQFLHVCYDLLNGKVDHEKFAEELTTALDWIMNHCFSLQDVSCMKDAIKKQFDWDETRSESEAEFGMIGHFVGEDKLHHPAEQFPCFPQETTSNGHDLQSQSREMYSDEEEEIKNIKGKLITAESQKETLEGRLQSATDRIESLTDQLRESEKTIDNSRLELQSLKESHGILEDQIKNHTIMKSDLDAQHKEAELKEVGLKVLELEVELENKNHSCEELETRCLELQLQLESMSKEGSNHDINQKDKPLRTDLEITAASEKLAECQETILNLGKQLRSLALPKDASLFDNVIAAQPISTTSTTTITTTKTNPIPAPLKVMKKNRSLLDQMLSEDDTKSKVSKVSDRDSDLTTIPGIIQPLEKILSLNEFKAPDDSVTANDLAIVTTKKPAVVPTKKPGSGSLWKKLLWKKKKSTNTKTSLPLNT